MSAGPGRWQRLLLNALDDYDVVPVADLLHLELGRIPTRPEMVAARRAARSLAEAGHARAVYVYQCNGCGKFTAFACCGTLRMSLALTRDPDVKTARPATIPGWVSVASSQGDIEATLTAYGVPS